MWDDKPNSVPSLQTASHLAANLLHNPCHGMGVIRMTVTVEMTKTQMEMMLMTSMIVTCAIAPKYDWKLFARVWVVSVYLKIDEVHSHNDKQDWWWSSRALDWISWWPWLKRLDNIKTYQLPKPPPITLRHLCRTIPKNCMKTTKLKSICFFKIFLYWKLECLE